MGKCRTVLKTECKATPADTSQDGVARAEEISKEDKICCSILPRLEGKVLKAAGPGSGIALG